MHPYAPNSLLGSRRTDGWACYIYYPLLLVPTTLALPGYFPPWQNWSLEPLRCSYGQLLFILKGLLLQESSPPHPNLSLAYYPILFSL